MARGLLFGLVCSPLLLLALALLGKMVDMPSLIFWIIGVPLLLCAGLVALGLALGGHTPPVPPQAGESPRPGLDPETSDPRAVNLAAHMGLKRQYRGWRYVPKARFSGDTPPDTPETPRKSPPKS